MSLQRGKCPLGAKRQVTWRISEYPVIARSSIIRYSNNKYLDYLFFF